MPTSATQVKSPHLDQIATLLAEKGYEVSEAGPNVLRIREVGTGIALQAVLQHEILFLSLSCITVPASAITPEIMHQMLASDNGISTSYFQLYATGTGQYAVTLNNFCKIQDMAPDDQDDILSCVHFLLVDVIEARRLLGGLLR